MHYGLWTCGLYKTVPNGSVQTGSPGFGSSFTIGPGSGAGIFLLPPGSPFSGPTLVPVIPFYGGALIFIDEAALINRAITNEYFIIIYSIIIINLI